MIKWIKKAIGWLPVMEVLELCLNVIHGWIEKSSNKVDDKIYNVIRGLLMSAFGSEHDPNMKVEIAKTILNLLDTLVSMTDNEVDDKLVLLVRKMLENAIGEEIELENAK